MRPGSHPRQHNANEIRESAEQIPRLTQTGRGGKRTAKTAKKQSEEHIISFKTDFAYCNDLADD